MRGLILFLLIFALFAGNCLAGEIQQIEAVLGPWGCDGKLYHGDWPNLSGRDWYVKSIQHWIGMTLGKADVLGLVQRNSDEFVIEWWGWDRYALPTGPHMWLTDFGNNYVLVRAGDGVRFTVACDPIEGNPIAHEFWLLRYTFEP